ncbi:MAG: iron ABC transporter permease [Roseovarius confluentis]
MAFLATGALSIGLGTVSIEPSEVSGVLFHRIFPGFLADPPEQMTSAIVLELRLPRFLVAFCVGAGLALVGGMLQTTTRNDLADPFLFGISSGAAAGAVFAISWAPNFFGPLNVQIFAFLGALTSSAVVLGFALRSTLAGSQQLILVGLAVSFVFSSITSYLVFSGDQRAEQSILFWTFGGLGLSRWNNFPLVAAATFCLALYALLSFRKLDVYFLGDDVAQSLGVDSRVVRIEVLLVSSLVTASFVSITGVVGFVGLMAPHIARFLFGPRHKILLAGSFFVGGMILSVADVCSRAILPSRELPISVITSFFGAIFVLFLVLRPERFR